MLNYNHLHYFHVAASEGSIAAAAQKLGVTQPTVSEQLRNLERALRTTLFERLPSGLKLTDAGKLAFEQTSVMFRASERLVESLGQTRRAVPRSLRIGLSSAVARSTSTDFLLPILAIDDCMPVIRGGDTAELVRELRGGELDLVLSESQPPEATRRGLELATIEHLTLVAVAPDGVELGNDWQGAGLIHYRPSSPYRWEVEAFLDARGLRPQIVAESDDPAFLVEAAARGGYLAVVPRSIARDAIVAGRLRVVERLDGSQAGVFALYQDGVGADLARRAVKALIEQATSHATE
ncbi:MAG: LysR family transcriptional regulator [Kofleriaceae bacterium]